MKIGVVSLAHIHSAMYLDVLKDRYPDELVGVFEPEAKLAAAHATDGVRIFDDWDRFLAAGPRAVIVCSENARHRQDTLRAFAAGLHVLCEKPLATTAAAATEMVGAAAGANRVLMTAFPMRFAHAIVTARDSLARGEYGRLTSVVAVNQGRIPSERRWFLDREAAGGGAVTDHTVHLVDVLRWYTGSEVEEVYAVANRIIAAQQTELETGGLVSLRFANGVTASIDCSWSRPGGYPTWGGLALRLLTSEGVVDVDAFAGRIPVYGATPTATCLSDFGPDANALMIDEFIAACTDSRPPRVTGEDGLRAVEVVAAAYESIETGRPVRMPPRG